MSTPENPHGLSPRAEFRQVAGFVVAPPTAGIITFLIFLTLFHFDLDPSPGITRNPVGVAGSLGFSAFVVAVPTTVFGAFSGVRWLRRRGMLSLRNLLLLGAALGNVPLAIAFLIFLARVLNGTLPGPPPGLSPAGDSPIQSAALFRSVAVGLAAGLSSAAVFWAIAVRGTGLADHPPQ